MAERNDELLSSFNVASFKSDEDDQAFWNRLIPVDQRPSKQPEVQEDLGIRTARLKFTEDVSIGLDLHAVRTQPDLCSQRDPIHVLPYDTKFCPSAHAMLKMCHLSAHELQECMQILMFLPFSVGR